MVLRHAVTVLFGTLMLMVACSSEGIDIPLEEFGLGDGLLEFSEEKYDFGDSTGFYYLSFSNEFFEKIIIAFAFDNKLRNFLSKYFYYSVVVVPGSFSPSYFNTDLISSIGLAKTFDLDEHGKSKFLQVSEILRSFYGNDFDVVSKETEDFQLNKQIWKIGANTIELRHYHYPSNRRRMYLEMKFHPEADVQILDG